MSWLRDHFYRFVFPAFINAEKLSSEIGGPVDVKESPLAPQKLPPELRKLWTLCQEYKVNWANDAKESTYGTNLGGGSVHRANAKINGRILRSTLDSAVVAMREERKGKLLLAGRDVWALAVLAEKRRIPYIFIPEISRNVAASPAVVGLLERYGCTGNELLIDTGFAGSIPRSLERETGRKIPFRLMSQNRQYTHSFLGRVPARGNRDSFPQQLFPNRKKARAEALETEYLGKYWKTGTIRHKEVFNVPGRFNDPIVVQHLSNRDNIQRAALMTSMLWRGLDMAGQPEPKMPVSNRFGVAQSFF